MQDNRDVVKPCVMDKSSATLDRILDKIIQNAEYVHYEIDKQCMSAKYNSISSEFYEIDIKGTSKKGEKEINLFAKCLKPEKRTSFVSMANTYAVEFFVYIELFKIFEEIQKEANVPIEDRYKTAFFYEESTPVIITMENMAKKGFTTFGSMDLVTLPLAKVFVKELARFHCLSFVLKERRPEYFDKITKSFNNYIKCNEDWELFMESVKSVTVSYVDEKFKRSIERKYDFLAENYSTYYNNDTTTACICHGDFKANNILVKMEDGEVQETICLDYQHAKFACPIYDFLYFIYFNTDREFRKAHMSDLKNLYYDTLSIFMKKFDVDPESVYPRMEFERAYQEKLEFGLSVSLAFMLLAFVPNDGTSDWQDVNYEVDDRFKERISGVIEDYAEWGYL